MQVKMYGQSKIQNTFNNFTLETLPKSIMLVAEQGSGKRTLATNLADRLNIDLVEVEHNFSDEDLIEYNRYPFNRLYYIDLASFNEKEQNKLLKFVEEPSSTVNIIIGVESDFSVISTLANRCIKYHFESYNFEDLKEIMKHTGIYGSIDLDENIIKSACRTPEDILNYDQDKLKNLYNLCTGIVEKINKANYANTLGISTKINYKEDYSKFDFNSFFNMLEYCAFNEYKNTNSAQALLVYLKSNEYKKTFIKANHPVKEQFMVNFLSNLWNEVHS